MAASAPEHLRRDKSISQSKREISSQPETPSESAESKIYELTNHRDPVSQPPVGTVNKPTVVVAPPLEADCVVEVKQIAVTQPPVVVPPPLEANRVVEIEESDNQSDGTRVQISGLQRKKTAEFSITAVVVSGMLLVAVFMVSPYLEGRVSQLHLSICVLLLICTLISGVLLFRCWRSRCAINLLFITCALLIGAAASYLALLHIYYWLLLLPTYLVLFYLRIRTTHCDPTTTEYGSIKAVLKKSFGFSSSAFSLSFSGLLTFVIAFLKSPSGADAHGKRVLDIVCAIILFLVCTVALVLVLLSSSPPKLEDRNGRAPLSTFNILKASGIALLFTLHLMASIVSYVLWGGGNVALLVALLTFFSVVGFAVHSAMQRGNVQQTSAIDTTAKLALKFISNLVNVGGICFFSGLLGVFAFRSNGGGGDSAVLKISVVLYYLFTFCCIMLLLLEAPTNRTVHSDPTTAEDRSIKADRKKSFGFSSNAFSVSFSGIIALWKILSGADAHGKQELYAVFAIILFLECVIALGLAFLSCLLLKLEHMINRALLPTYKTLKTWGLVQWFTLYLVAAIMGWIVIFSGGGVAQLAVDLVSFFCLWVCAAAYWWSFAMRRHEVQQMSTIDGAAACKQHLKLIERWANAMTIVSFSGVLAVFVFDGDGDGAVLPKIGVVALINLFLFSFGIMMLLFEAPNNERLIVERLIDAINILFYCSAFVLVWAIVRIGVGIMKIT